MSNAKLNILALGASLGIVWAAGLFVTGLFANPMGWGSEFVNVMGSIYIGYKTGFVGAIIGAVWGFIDMFVAGVVIGWIYNFFVK